MEVAVLLFFLNPKYYQKMQFGQILVYLTTNIVTMFLAQCWRLKTSFRPFMILMKWQYNEICQFLVIDIYHF